MELQGKESSQRGQQEEITITAPKEEWKEIERLITSYRQQSKTLKRFTTTLGRLTSFQRRLTQATGWKSPDDYFI